MHSYLNNTCSCLKLNKCDLGLRARRRGGGVVEGELLGAELGTVAMDLLYYIVLYYSIICYSIV